MNIHSLALFRCEFCQSLAPVWAELATMYNEHRSSIVIASVNCVSAGRLCSNNDVTVFQFCSVQFLVCVLFMGRPA